MSKFAEQSRAIRFRLKRKANNLLSSLPSATIELENLTIIRNIEYAEVDGLPLKLDLYLPRNGDERSQKLVLWIHGGGWLGGSKRRPQIRWLTDRGFALASIEYRLSFEALFPAQIHDCKGAVRWLRSKASDYGYNADKIGVGGISAGAHLAALLGTTNGIEELEGIVGGNEGYSSSVSAVLDYFGPTDFLAMIGQPGSFDHGAADSPESLLVGGPIMDHPNRVLACNPMSYLSDETPPFLIIHGTEDPIVPPNQSRLLHTALEERGFSSELHMLEGAGHGGTEFFDEGMRPVIEGFFEKHLFG